MPAVDTSSMAQENDLKGKPAAKGKPGAKEVEKELTEEEKAALAKLKQERMEKAARLQEDWNQMSDMQKFHYIAENRSKECHVEFPVNPPTEEGAEPEDTGCEEITIEMGQMKELESNINNFGCCSIGIEKLVPKADEEAKGGKPAKGKPPSEEAKPVSGIAEFDLVPFQFPGATTSTQKIFIQAGGLSLSPSKS